MLVIHCHLRIKITEDNTAETSPSKHSPQPLLEIVGQSSMFRSATSKWEEAVRSRYSDYSSSHTPQAVFTSDTQLSPWLDPTHRDGNGSLSG